MANIYKKLFEEVCYTSGKFLLHDFNEIKGITNTNNNKTAFIISSYKKVFDVLVNSLYKAKYNGIVSIPTKAHISRNISFTGQQVIENSASIKKTISVQQSLTNNHQNTNESKYLKTAMIKIVEETQDSISVKLSNAREERNVYNKIILLPIDGLISFSSGINDFSIVLILQTASIEQPNTFETQQVFIYNPFTNDIYTIDNTYGFLCNTCKMSPSSLQPQSVLNSVFVDNYSASFSFNLNKLIQISDVCLSSTSIFNTLGLLATTTTNLVVYHTHPNKMIQSIIDFCIQKTLLQTRQIGNHLLIGEETILNKFK